MTSAVIYVAQVAEPSRRWASRAPDWLRWPHRPACSGTGGERPLSGGIAVTGSEEYADWSQQLLQWPQVGAALPECIGEVGFREPGDGRSFDAAVLVAQLREQLTVDAAAGSGYPENEALVIDPKTGVPMLERYRAD
ncbi:hypothetical protein [Streptomyces wedmorensis]